MSSEPMYAFIRVNKSLINYTQNYILCGLYKPCEYSLYKLCEYSLYKPCKYSLYKPYEYKGHLPMIKTFQGLLNNSEKTKKQTKSVNSIKDLFRGSHMHRFDCSYTKKY